MDCNHDAPYAQLAVQFANALASGDFTLAHSLLSPELGINLTPDRLREDYRRMIEYGDGPPTEIQLVATLETWQWPEPLPTDLGWAYVAIAGDGYSEAITTIVEAVENKPAIRHLEWGRP